MIKEIIEEMQKTIPVEWDRFAVDEKGDYDIYGWIKRNDGQRDFILLQLFIENGEVKGGFCTSSAKYSKAIFDFLYPGTEDKGHNKCQKISELNA